MARVCERGGRDDVHAADDDRSSRDRRRRDRCGGVGGRRPSRDDPALATLLPGVVLLAAFIPEHITLWEKFPVWYHLTFLLSLIPLTFAGGKMAQAPH